MRKDDPDYIRWLLTTNDKAVERAMVALYDMQTAGEQSDGSTRELNGKGFSAYDARNGTYYAKWVKSGRSLSGKFLVKARLMSLKYAAQLAKLASAKMNVQSTETTIQ